MASTYTNLLYHIVFSTKGRRRLITELLEPELFAYIGGIIRGERGTLLEIGGTRDHVHLVASLRASVSVADMTKLVKSNSSKWINQRASQRAKFGWQIGYGAFTVSRSQLSSVKHYVRRQKDHHRTVSFKEEFIEFLRKHGIEYEERYLWD